MALTAEELAAMRVPMSHEMGASDASGGCPRSKSQINAVLQAIENRLTATATKNALSADIDAATSPVVWNTTEKRIAVAWVMRRCADRWT